MIWSYVGYLEYAIGRWGGTYLRYLPVADLPRATAFYEAVGAVRNPQYSNETAACMVFSER